MLIEHILVPVDYSQCSARALSYACSLAEKFGATLAVVHAWDRPAYIGEELMVHGAGKGPVSIVELVRQNAERDMAEFIASVKIPSGLRLEQQLLNGNPAAKILDLLKSGRFDLLVVGTHGRTGLNHVLLGSVAETLVRLSPVPVLTVPRA